MQEVEKKILAFLKKVQRRQICCNFVTNLWICCIASVSFAILIEVLSKMLPLYYKSLYQVMMLVVCICVYSIYTILGKPSLTRSALYIDSFGFKERLTTAVELMGNDTEFSRLVKKSAAEVVDCVNIKKLIRPEFKRNKWIASVLLFALFTVLVNIHSTKMDEAKRMHALSELKRKEILALEKLKREIFNTYRLSRVEKEKIDKIILKFKKEVRNSKTKDEIELAKQKTWFLLSELKKTTKNMQTQSALEKLKDLLSEANKKTDFNSNNSYAGLSSKGEDKEKQPGDLSKTKDNTKDEQMSKSGSSSDDKNPSSNSSEDGSTSAQAKGSDGAPLNRNNTNNSKTGEDQQRSSDSSLKGRGIGASVPKRSYKVEKPAVYTKNLLNIDAYRKVSVENKQENGTTFQRQGVGERGQKLSFDRVFSYYKEEVNDYLQTDQIPSWAKEITKRYFESLQDWR